MEDISNQFLNYLFTFDIKTTTEDFQQEIGYHSLTVQKTYSYLYSCLNQKLQELLEFMSSNNPIDYEHLVSLSNVLIFINKNYLKDLETIVLSKCEIIFDTCLEILDFISKAQQVDFSKTELIKLMIIIIQEVMKPYPNDLYLHINNKKYLDILIISLSMYFDVRNFVLFLIQTNSNRDMYDYFIKNLNAFFNGIKSALLQMPFEEIIIQAVSIAQQFRNNFKDIDNEFYLFIIYIIDNTQDKRKEIDIKTLFSSLFDVIIQDNQNIFYGIGNMLLRIYEYYIDSSEICQAVISSFFTHITGEYYVRFLQNTDLIEKFISKLYNQKNQDTIAYFFYFLNSLSFAFETILTDVYIPKIEFKSIIESIQYFTDNEQILKFILERLKSLFDQKCCLATYFLSECDYFQQLKNIISKNNNISILMMNFTEDLFRKNFNEEIWKEATKANTFSYDTIITLDPLMQKIIWINLTYEQKPEKFYEKAHKLISHMSPIISQLRSNKADANCHEFIIFLRILLKSITQTKMIVIYSANSLLFNDIVSLIKDFTLVITNKQDLWGNIYLVFDAIFSFVYQFNRRIMTYKFKEIKNIKRDKKISSLPILFSPRIIKTYIKDILDNLSEKGSKRFLCYLFEKCIRFNDENDNSPLFDPKDLDPITYFQQTFKIPLIETPMKCSNTFLNSRFVIKCLTSAIFKTNLLKHKLYLLSFLELLCKVNEHNISVLLRGGIVKTLFKYYGPTELINAKILTLLNQMMIFFNKEDLKEYLKHVYNFLITEHNIETAKKMLSMIENSLPHSVKYIPSITFSPLNTHHTGTYNMFLLDNQLTKDPNIRIYFNLFISSIQSLNCLTLCQLSSKSNSIHIYFVNKSLCVLHNKKEILSIPNLNEKIQNFNKWYTVLIIPSSKFLVSIKQSLISISYPTESLFSVLNNAEKKFDFAFGYIKLKEINKYSNQIPIEYCYEESTPYITLNYLLLTTEEITEQKLGIQVDNNKNNPNSELVKICSKNKIAEVMFDEITLVNVQGESRIVYKMSDPFDLDLTKTELLSKIQCNDGLNGFNNLYLFKNCNILDYASMNEVFKLETLNKTLLTNLLFGFNEYLHITLNDIFFADLLFVLLDNMDNSTFLSVYINIFSIILAVDGEFQSMFFKRHFSNLQILLSKYAHDFKLDFVSLFIYNKNADINEGLQYQLVSNIFFYPQIYTKLNPEIQMKINIEFEKFLNFNENYNEVDITKMQKILVSLWFMLTHYETDINTANNKQNNFSYLTNCIFLLNSIILNGSSDNGDIAPLSVLSLSIKSTLNEYLNLKDKFPKNQVLDLPFIYSERIVKQIKVYEVLIKDFISKLNINQQKTGFTYLSYHFDLEFLNFKNIIKYEKVKRSLKKSIQMLCYEFKNEKDQFSWYLDKREGNGRMRRRMILKLNPEIDEDDNKENNSINEIFKRLSILDSISDIPLVKCMVDHNNDKYQNSFICLLIETNSETASLLILGDKSMYIYTNIICDKNNKLHLFSTVSSRSFWATNDNEEEWDTLIQNNKTENKDSIKDPNIYIDHKSRRIKMKVMEYDQISELHKRRYMHQNNSFEIFLSNGSSYFITVFPKLRDELFNRILSNINQNSQSKIANIGKGGDSAVVYLKHYPIINHKTKQTKKREIAQGKAVVEIKNIINEASEKWSQGFISNFNYIMLINTLGGRTYNDLSQYFIFPWILNDFFSPKFCLNQKAYFRDLKYPTHAQSDLSRANLKEKVSNNNAQELHHSGIFFSNPSLISYYLIRIQPFTGVSIEVNGGDFDSGDRIFNSMKIFSKMKNITQEWIPELIYFPEYMIDISKYSCTRNKQYNSNIRLNDVQLPSWAKYDPRLLTQVLQKAVESPIVSDNLHNWIDLVFGYKMPFGKINFEYYNRYLSACYFYEDLKGKKYDQQKLNVNLLQTKEFGSNPLQIIFKSHIQKREWNLYSFLAFFGTLVRIENCKLKNIKLISSIKSNEIGDMKGLYEIPKFNTSNGEGGLSAFTSYIDQSFEEHNDEDGKLSRRYFVVGKNKTLLGPSFTSVLSHNKTSIYISKPCYKYTLEFYLNEQARIVTSISSQNGKYIVVGLSNGAVIKYKKKMNTLEEIPSSLEKMESKPIRNSNQKMTKVIYPKMFSIENMEGQFNDFCEINDNVTIKSKKEKYLLDSLYEIERSSIPSSSIIKLVICENYSFLLVIDKLKNVYLYDFNRLKLRYKFNFTKVTKSDCSIKHVKIIHQSCDFIISTKFSFHLFSINGLPILDINLFESNQFARTPITAIEAISLSDTLIFTGHEDGSFYISKIRTEIPLDFQIDDNSNTDQKRPLYEAYHQRYNMSYIPSASSESSNQKRKLNILKKIDTTKNKIIYLKISDDMGHLFIINKNKYLFSYGCEDYLKGNQIKGKKCKIHKETRIQCKCCKKLLCELCLKNEEKYSISLCEECDLRNISADNLTLEY